MTDFTSVVNDMMPEDAPKTEQPTNDNSPRATGFADLVDQVSTDHQAEAEALNASLQGTDAEKFARAADLGKQFGLPPQAVLPNLGEYAQRAELIKENNALQKNPQLAGWVSNNPDLAGAAKGDYDNLDTIGKSAVQLGLASSPLDHYIQEIGRDIVQAGTWLNPYIIGAHLFDIPLHAGALATQYGLGKLSPSNPLYVSPSSAYNTPPTFGALFDKIGETLFPGGTPESRTAELVDVASQFAAPGAMLRAPSLAMRGFNAMIGASVGAGGQISQEKAAEWAKQKFPDSPVMQTAISQTAGLLSMIGIGGVGHTAGTFLHDRFVASQSMQDNQNLNDLMDKAAQNQTRARSPDAFQSFVESQTNGAPVENVFVPADKVVELYQSQNITPGPDDGLLGKAVPDIAEQIAQATPRGADIVIPTANYAAHLAGTPIDGTLRPDLRVRQDGMSFNEARDYQARFNEIVGGISKDFEQSQLAQEPARLIFDNMQKKAEDAGFTTKQAAQYAALTASRYMTRASRLGIDPLELYREQGIELRRAQPGETVQVGDLTQATPNLAVSLDESGRPISKTRPISSPATQEPSRQISERAVPEGVFTTRTTSPSSKEGGTTSSDLSGISGSYHKLEDIQAIKDAVQQAEPDLKAFLKDIVENTGGSELDKIRLKNENGINQKLEYRQPNQISDYLGGRIIVDSREVADQVLDQLQQYGKVTHIDDFFDEHGRQSGYRAIHAQLEAANGISAEVQIQLREVNEIFGEAHKLYKQLKGEADLGKVEELQQRVKQLFDDAWQKSKDRELAQAERGKVALSQGKKIITFFEKADKSTFLHEMGHIWLEEMRADAMREGAPEQLKTDWEAIKKSIGHEGDGRIGTESHEKFARSFEKYLMDGKAPSGALLGAFRRFKLWLTNIYRSVSGLGAEVNDDLREVFNRMLATDDEIHQVEQRQHVNRLFNTAKEAGMTDKEFAAYNNTALNAEQAAREQLLTEAMQDIVKRRTRSWNAADDEIRPRIEATIRSQRDMRMLDYFRTGKLRDDTGKETEIPAMKIDRDALQALYGGGQKGIEKLLPTAIQKAITEKDGLEPDEIAPFLGYGSGKEMVDDMLALGKTEKSIRDTGSKASIGSFLADQEVNRQLHEKFGLSDEALRQRAEEIVSGADRMDLKLAELRALGRKSGQTVSFTRDSLKQWAQSQIGNMTAKDAANVFSFVRAMGKAGREAERAVAKGDDQAAFQALQKQALNMAMATEARTAEDVYTRAIQTFKKLASKSTIKSADQEYLDQVHGILRQFGFDVNRNDQELTNALAGKNLQGFVEQKVGNGRDLEVPDFLLDGQQREFKKLTYTQLSGLKDAIDSLMHNARDEQKITINGIKLERDQVISDILKNLDEFPKKQRQPYLNPQDAGKLRYGLDRFTSTMRAADAELLKPEQFLDWLDKRDTLGPLNKTVFRPLKEAQINEMDLLKEKAKSFANLPVPKDWHKTMKLDVPNPYLLDPDTGLPARMSRKTMLTIALNTGNASNFKKLAEGYKWQPDQVMNFLHTNMTKADWDFVQHSWNSFESLWPMVEELQRRTTGIAPEKIIPSPIKTPFGDYAGGYYPVVYDPRTTITGKRALSIDSIFDNDYFRPATGKGHTISRLENFTDRISLNLDILPWKLRQTIHDLTFREAIVNADKILSDTRFQRALEDTWGPEYGKEFRPWLKDIANQPNADNRPMSFIDNALRYSRMTMVEVGIGFRLTTMAKHGLTALSNSVGEIGPDWMRRGVTEYYSDHEGKKAFVFDRSGEMRNRMTQYDRDIRENLASLLGEDSTLQQMRRFGHYGVAYLDMESAVPTWIGAYRKGLSEDMTEDDAVYYADKTVRNAHGAQGLVDMAGVQRGPEYKKIFTMFYGFFNHMYNRQRDLVRRARNMETPMDLAKVLGKTVAYIAVPAMVEQVISGSQKPEDEGWGAYAAKAIAGQLAATLPLVRDVAGYLEHGHGGETPLSRMIQAFGNQAKDIGKWMEGEDASKKWLRHAIETPGYIFAAPTGQAAVSAQFLWDVSDGKEDPENLHEWMHGLMYGTAKPKQ